MFRSYVILRFYVINPMFAIHLFPNIFFFQRSRQIELIIMANSLDGHLQSIKPFRINDLNLCSRRLSHSTYITFGENVRENCQIDLKSLIDLGESQPWFYNLYLNYTENNLNLMKPVPVLIRNSFSHNMVSELNFFKKN